MGAIRRGGYGGRLVAGDGGFLGEGGGLGGRMCA